MAVNGERQSRYARGPATARSEIQGDHLLYQPFLVSYFHVSDFGSS